MIPLEQPPIEIILRCEQDGIIQDNDAVIIDGDLCCPFCCESLDVEFHQGDRQIQEPETLVITRLG